MFSSLVTFGNVAAQNKTCFRQQKFFPQFQKHDVFAKWYNILLDETMFSGLPVE
jgi:hypothetical protein